MNESKPKPLLKWVGGKSKMLNQLIPFFPKNFKNYYEPFLGGAAVALHVASEGRRGKRFHLSDLNEEIVNLYNVACKNPLGLSFEINLLICQYSEEHFYKVRSEIPACPVKAAARTLYLNKCGFNGLYRVNSKGEFNVSFGQKKDCPPIFDGSLFTFGPVIKKVKCLPFDKALRTAGVGSFVYCDPPYEPISETSSFTGYGPLGFTRKDQALLKETCEAAHKRGAYVVISNSYCPFILDLYKEHEIHIVEANRYVSCVAGSRGKVKEVVIVMR
jgi:DNA adenine methylase